MKKVLALLFCVAIAFFLCACGEQEDLSTPEDDAAQATVQETEVKELLALPGQMFEQPALVTSVGQSADVAIVNTLLTRAGVETYQNSTIAASEMSDSYPTLVLAIGGSSKGLGAAGIDADEELARVTELIAAAKEKGMKIIALHIGGTARRGTLSDQFIPSAIAAADAAIILSSGDKDNMMRDILVENDIPAQYIEQQIDAVEPLQLLFGL